MYSIDINCDLGEGVGLQQGLGLDKALLEYVSSVNIACGFHAGDASIMHQTVLAAKAKGIAIGAHPSLLDREGFGRRQLPTSPREVYQITLYQVGALAAMAKVEQVALHHVKPHGALYNMAAANGELALAIAQAVHDFDPDLILYGLSGSQLLSAGKQLGLQVASEVFADRTYQPDGSLTPRSQANSLIEEEEQAICQAVDLVLHGQVTSIGGDRIALQAETICLHGDGQQALSFAKAIYQRFLASSIRIQAIPHLK